jgi:hypothetical protein
MARYTDYVQLEIGTTSTSMVPVIELQLGGVDADVPPPKATFQEASAFQDVANADIKMLGKPVIRWSWSAGSSYTARKAMRQFITTGLTADVFIASQDKDGDIQTYATKMRWPREPYALQSFEYVQPFVIEFFRCVEQ